jgi:hypothetical protein
MQCWGLQEQLKQGVHCLTWPTPPAEEESLVLLLCDWPPDERVTQTGWPVDQLVVDFPASHTAQRQGQGLGCCCWVATAVSNSPAARSLVMVQTRSQASVLYCCNGLSSLLMVLQQHKHYTTHNSPGWLSKKQSHPSATYLPRSGSHTMIHGLCPNHILNTGPYLLWHCCMNSWEPMSRNSGRLPNTGR